MEPIGVKQEERTASNQKACCEKAGHTMLAEKEVTAPGGPSYDEKDTCSARSGREIRIIVRKAKRLAARALTLTGSAFNRARVSLTAHSKSNCKGEGSCCCAPEAKQTMKE